MHRKKVRNEYNKISGNYNKRYELNPLKGVAKALRELVAEIRAQRVLEIGCGTGYWLKILAPHVDWIVGLDTSIRMLKEANHIPGTIQLVCGSADRLPFSKNSFDLVFVVNALHHFPDKKGFINQAGSLLRSAGALATIGLDVSSAIGCWVIYDYFPGAIEFDQSRFPHWEQVRSWMSDAGLTVRDPLTVEHIKTEKRGLDILDDHFIQRYGTSQFMGLTAAQYRQGIESIKLAISEAESKGEQAVFNADLQLKMVVGYAQ